jgi:hypothetical protein
LSPVVAVEVAALVSVREVEEVEEASSITLR